jgi:hypothetical protein
MNRCMWMSQSATINIMNWWWWHKRVVQYWCRSIMHWGRYRYFHKLISPPWWIVYWWYVNWGVVYDRWWVVINWGWCMMNHLSMHYGFVVNGFWFAYYLAGILASLCTISNINFVLGSVLYVANYSHIFCCLAYFLIYLILKV